MVPFRATGDVVDRDSGAGMSGLRVEAWDSKGICSDLIGCAFTGLHGAFELALDEDYLRGLFRDRTPILFFRIFDATGNVITSTEERILWTAQGAVTAEFRIEVNLSQHPQLEAQPASFTVRGHLRITPASVRVKAFDKRLDHDVLLGWQDVNMPVEGDFYRITYRIGPTRNAMVEQTLPGKQAADLVVRVFALSGNVEAPVEGAMVAESTVYCHAPPTATIDVTAANYRNLSELEVLIARLTPALDGAALGSVTDAQIPHLACSTGISVEQVTRIVAAARLSGHPEALYALFRAVGSNVLRDVLRLKPSTAARLVAEAGNHRIIPPLPADMATIFATLVADVALSEPVTNSTSTLGDLLAIAFSSSTDRDTFIRKYITHDGPIEDFWAVLSADNFQDAATRARVQRVLQLGALARYHLPLVIHLDGLFQNDPQMSIKDLATKDEAAWLAILELPAIGYPTSIPGEDPGVKRTNYAAVLTRTMERAFPTAAIAARVTDPKLITFFTNEANASFEFGKTRLAVHLARTSNALSGIAGDGEPAATVEKLFAMERLFKIVPRHDKMKMLLDDGIHSAQGITRMGRSRFVARYATAFGGPTPAQVVFDKASQVTAMAVALFTKYSADVNSLSAHVLPKVNLTPGQPGQDEVFADWAALFGPADLCACEHAQSVYGPPAYLVDSLQFLGRQPVGNTTAKDKLFERRPDLQRIELSCENTNTPVPYIDLVNEILEIKVARTVDPNVPVYSGPIRTTGTAEELASMPELFSAEAIGVAYTAVASELGNWKLPFDFPAEAQRTLLSHVGISRDTLMEVLSSDPNDAKNATRIAAEHLGLIALDRDAITSDVVPPWPADLHQVPKFLKVSGISYEQLLELLDATYVNGRDGQGFLKSPKVSIDPPDGCTVDGSTLQNLTPALPRLYALVRLHHKLGWSITDIDKVLAAFGCEQEGFALDDAFLRNLSRVVKLQAELKLPLDGLLTCWADIDTRSRDTPKANSFYQQLFLNKAVLNPVDEAFEAAADPNGVPVEPLEHHKPAILAALRIKDTDLSLLTAHLLAPSPLLRLKSLSVLCRAVMLARGLGLSIRELLLIGSLTGPDPFGFADAADTMTFVQTVARVRASGFRAAELHYLLRHFSAGNDSGAPVEAAITSVLDDIQAGIVKILADAEQVSDPTGELVHRTFDALLPAADAEQAIALLDMTSTQAAGDLLAFFEAKLAKLFLNPTQLAANLIGIADTDSPMEPQPPYDAREVRYRAVLPGLTAYLKGANLIKQTLATALKVDVNAVEHLLQSLPAQVNPAREAMVDFLPWDPAEDPGARRARHEASFLRLHKAAMLIVKLQIAADELPLLVPALSTGWLDWGSLPVGSTMPAASFAAWERLADLCAFRKKYLGPGGKGALSELLSTGDVAAFQSLLSRHTGWALADIETLCGATGWNLSFPADCRDERRLHQLGTAFGVLKRLGVSAQEALRWSHVNVPILSAYDNTLEIRRAVKAKYDEAAWLAVARPMRDLLREKERDALVTYLVAKGGYEDSNALFADLLIDVEMSACQDTSRIKHAIGSVQLFVQRCLMNLETGIVLGQAAGDEWKWMKSYRVWEANRKVFLYPESWIEPDLRDDKTPFFKELENELSQGDMTEERVEEAFRRYLEKLHEVAHLDVVGLFREVDVNPLIDVLHVFARTRATPHVYYYRMWVDSKYWTPWEKITAEIQGSHLIPAVHQRRLYLFWPLIEKVDRGPAASEMKICLAWVERKNGKWSPKKVGQDQPVVLGYILPEERLSFGTFATDRLLISAWARDVSPWTTFSMIGGFQLQSCDGQLVSLTHDQVKALPPADWDIRTPLRSTATYMETQEQLGGTGDHLALPLSRKNKLDTFPVLETAPGRFRVLLSRDVFFWDVLFPGDPMPASVKHLFYKDASRTFFAHWEGETSLDWALPNKPFPLMPLPLGPDFSHQLGEGLIDWLDLNPSAESVLPVRPRGGYRFHTFYHPYACEFIKQLNARGLDGLLKWPDKSPIQLKSDDFFEAEYQPSSKFVLQPYPIDDVDFSFGGAYSQYNWELFFHAPLLIATRLKSNQRYEEARHWFHRIFDPTDGSTAPAPQRFWKVRPFYENLDLQSLHDQMVALAAEKNSHAKELLAIVDPDADPTAAQKLVAQIEAWRAQPFNPHLIARMRHVAYQKTTVMKYIENLIAWGDQLFSRDTIESIHEATLLYILAADILGDRPHTLPERTPPPPKTYQDLEPDLDDFSNALAKIESIIQLPPSGQGGGTDEPPPMLALYFCIPQNDKLVGYWDTVADRLFKIRHCMNIEGVVRSLPLFEPPIDPALLVRATAAGIDIASVLNELSAPLPHYRFTVMHAKAMEFAAGVISLGAELLSALEKGDAEALSRLRATHEIRVLEASRAAREKQITEAKETLAGLMRSKDVVTIRHQFYTKIERFNRAEQEYLSLAKQAADEQVTTESIVAMASVLHALPDIIVGLAGGTEFGPSYLARGMEAAAKAASVTTLWKREMASLNATMGSFSRREEEWNLQARLAAAELKQIDKQIVAAEIRVAIAEKELQNHDIQLESSREADEFLRNKFTNQELYEWTKQQVAAVYFQSYQLAVDMAKRAQRAFQFERCEPDASFIRFGYWDSLKQGLLAGEKLQYDLRRMEAAYLEQNKREYEITKHLSLSRLAPEALLALRATGVCELSIPESEFDLDFPGHYMRRIKAVSMTIPCVSGPYNGINCMLRLLNNKTRKSAAPEANYDDGPYIDDYRMLEAIATTTAQNDAGVFELSFRDERYLPFEGAGAVSKWRIELPKENNLIDVDTVDDVELHIRYMARDGGAPLKAKAMAALGTPAPDASDGAGPRSEGSRLLSVKAEFPVEWELFLNPPAEQNYQQLSLQLQPDQFDAHRGAASLTIKTMKILVAWRNAAAYRELETELDITVTPAGAAEPLDTPVTLVASAENVPLAPFAIGIVTPTDQDNPVGTTGQWVITVESAKLAALTPETQADTIRQEVPEESGFYQLKPDALDDLWILCIYDRLPAS